MLVLIHSIGLYSAAGTCFKAAPWTTTSTSFSAKFNIGTTILTWKVYDKYNNESSAQVNVNVYDAFGPIFYNLESDYTYNIDFTIEEDKNIYNGSIPIPSAYDAVDGWLNKVFYRKNVNELGWTDYVEVTTDASGSNTLNLDYYLGNTIIQWKAIDNSNNENENTGVSTINVLDGVGPSYDNNKDYDWIKENTFVINSHTNIYNGRIEVPRVYDLVDSWLNNVEYKRTKNSSPSISDNVLPADTDFVKLNTLPGGIQTFSNNWGHGTTTTT